MSSLTPPDALKTLIENCASATRQVEIARAAKCFLSEQSWENRKDEKFVKEIESNWNLADLDEKEARRKAKLYWMAALQIKRLRDEKK